jgi:hypothetical protein
MFAPAFYRPFGDIRLYGASGPMIAEPGDFDARWTLYERGLSTICRSPKIQIASGGAYTLAAGLEIEINGTWTSSNGSLIAGNIIRVQATSSPDYYVEDVSGTLAFVLTIGGVACTFTLINMVEPVFGPQWIEPGIWDDYLQWYEDGDSLPTENLIFKILSGDTVKTFGGYDLLFSSSDGSDILKYDDGSLYVGPSFTNDNYASVEGQDLTIGGMVYPYILPGTTQVSTAATSGGNGYSVDMDDSLLECYRGKPDGVETMDRPFTDSNQWASVTTTEITTDGFTTTGNGGMFYTEGAEVYLDIGQRYLIDFSRDTTAATCDLYGTQLNTSLITNKLTNGNSTFELTATQPGLYVRNVGAGVTSNVRLSVQKLEPIPMTTAVLVKMGKSSANITTPTNLLTVKSTISGIIYADSGGVIYASDGTNTCSVTVTGGWTAGTVLTIVLKITSTTIQIGYAVGAGTITYGTTTSYDGSFNPLTHIRFGYGTTAPIGIKMFAQWDAQIDDDIILQHVEDAL